MSKLAEFKALEAQLAAQLKQLDALKNDDWSRQHQGTRHCKNQTPEPGESEKAYLD
jgi:hypothetical protein|tara:strand:- start:208 stop:375 length:168 start_codon:yes stop_codon:yes gene_type:complete